MRFDDYAFEQCAQVVYIMNDSAREQYDSWEDLKSFMESMAYTYVGKHTHFATGGFVLTFSRSSVDKDDWFVTASVQPYTALRYIRELRLMERS
jgi:hypothetical protein